MATVQRAASIYAQLQNSGNHLTGQFLNKNQKDPQKRARSFKEILKAEIAKKD